MVGSTHRALGAALLLGLAACEDPPPPEPATEQPSESGEEPRGPAPVDPEARTVVWVGGDVLPAGSIRRALRETGERAAGFATLLAPTAEHWRRDGREAFVVVNLETPIADAVRVPNDTFTATKQGSRLVRAPLNAASWMVEGLALAQVDAVMLANNHALDQEREGLAETIRAARGAGLVTTGAGFAPHFSWPIVIGGEGVRTAVLTVFEKDFPEPELEPGQAGLSVLGEDTIELVREASAAHDAVVVVIHVVAELFLGVKDRWRTWAERLADAGADAIAFHGSHVPNPVEVLEVGDRRVVVAYGLGNMVSDMGTSSNPSRTPPRSDELRRWESPETREGLLMRVEVRPHGVTTSLLPIWMSHDRWLINNRVRPQGPIVFQLLPMAACGDATDGLERWPEPWRTEMVAWMGTRRDHVLEVTGLSTAGCTPGRIAPILAR